MAVTGQPGGGFSAASRSLFYTHSHTQTHTQHGLAPRWSVEAPELKHTTGTRARSLAPTHARTQTHWRPHVRGSLSVHERPVAAPDPVYLLNICSVGGSRAIGTHACTHTYTPGLSAALPLALLYSCRASGSSRASCKHASIRGGGSRCACLLA